MSLQRNSFIILALGVFMLVATTIFVKSYEDKQPNPIKFSYTKYPNIRQAVIKQLNIEFKDLLDILPDYEQIESSNIGIALYDLNDDGMDEVIAFAPIAYDSTANGGTYTPVFKQVSGSLKHLDDHFYSQGQLSVSPYKINGYRNINSFVFGHPFDKEQNHRYVLTVSSNGLYEFARSAVMTKKERRFWSHEKL